MSERAKQLAEQFQAANAAFIEEVTGLSEAQWQAVCPDENWSVGVTACHVANGNETIMRHIREFLADEPPEPDTWETVHARNAADAERFAGHTRAETLAHLRQAGDAAAEIVRDLSDAQLARRAPIVVGYPEVDVEWLAAFLVGHLEEHRDSIRRAVGVQVG